MAEVGSLLMLWQLGIALVSAAFAAGGAYLAVRTELRWHKEAILRNERQLEVLRNELKQDIDAIHSRINRMSDRVGTMTENVLQQTIKPAG